MTTSAIRTSRRNPARPTWQEPPSIATRTAKSGTLVVILLVVLVPLYSVVLTSFSNQASINVAGGLVVWPHGLTLSAYKLIAQGGVVGRALVVSLLFTAVGTVFSMIVTILASYGLSRTGSFGHRTILWFMMITMFFNGGVIPLFLVVSALGGFDQYWALVAPSAVSVFNVIVMRAFFMNIASDMIESARIDGASEWKILWRIVLPTSKAVTAVIALFYAVAYWNSWFNILLFMPSDSVKWPLQMVMYSYVTQGNPMPGSGTSTIGGFTGANQLAPLSIQMAVVTLTVVPVLLVYPFVQKHFTKGVLLGAIKGLCAGRSHGSLFHYHERTGVPRQRRFLPSGGRRDGAGRDGALYLAERPDRGGRLRRRAGVQPGAAGPGLRAYRHRRRVPVGCGSVGFAWASGRGRTLDSADGLHRLQRLERTGRGIHSRGPAQPRQGMGGGR
ncbi:MAG TPA: carbohydrate ABC transporter permease [Streptosporangiaceae bacterium]